VSCSIVRNQIRPFVVAARPVVRNLRPAAVNLAAATPHLTGVFKVLNHLLNMLGYYPSGNGQHGYLWWLAWLQHNTRTLFSIQNGDGDFRPLLLEGDCKEIKKIGGTNGGVAGGILFAGINGVFCPKAVP
jgi:phospholipid/cholesterol/gamma-HCH transport system substrate-binding protein